MPRVHFVNEMITVEVPEGTTLREVAIKEGVELYRGMWTHLNCLGNGLCGRCRLWVLSEGASRPSLRERAHRLVRGNQRLACQVRIFGDLEVRTRPLGPATVRPTSPVPSYREAAERRLREAREAEAVAAKKAAEKKAADEKAAAEKKAAEKKAADEKAAAEKKAAEEKAAAEQVPGPAVEAAKPDPTAGTSSGTSTAP